MKSVYSVILRDELVKELDAVAYRNGVSRSVMLNKILADYLCVETPDTFMENVFTQMEALFSEITGMHYVSQASSSMAAVTSALEYRYNPKVKYSVELFPAGDLGQLKVSLRSQNPVLIALLEDFYNFFVNLERKYLGERTVYYADNKFIRVFRRPEHATAEQIGDEIAKYVKTFDLYMRRYTAGFNILESERINIELDYVERLKGKEILL